MITNFKIFFFSLFGRLLFNFCFGFSKWKINGYQNLDKALKTNNPVLLCVWHGRSIFAAYFLSKIKIKKSVVVGLHKDAEIIGKILLKWNFKLIRGSSSRGNKNVINLLNKKLVPNNLVCITNDGPRGPVHVAKKGSLEIALKKNAVFLPVTGTSNCFWKFNSWDKFILPKPFSKIQFSFGKPFKHNPKFNISIEDYVSKQMNDLQKRSDLLI